jgi:hypothetical protein
VNVFNWTERRWWGIQARLDGLLCYLRRHRVEWRANVDDGVCPGDIVCHTCDRIHWCRWYDNRRNWC